MWIMYQLSFQKTINLPSQGEVDQTVIWVGVKTETKNIISILDPFNYRDKPLFTLSLHSIPHSKQIFTEHL